MTYNQMHEIVTNKYIVLHWVSQNQYSNACMHGILLATVIDSHILHVLKDCSLQLVVLPFSNPTFFKKGMPPTKLFNTL